MATSRLERLLKELKASPHDVRRLEELAAVYEQEGHRDAAARTLVVVAELWALDGNVFRAAALTKRAARLAPHNVEAIQLLVKWHELLGLFPEAESWRLKLPGG